MAAQNSQRNSNANCPHKLYISEADDIIMQKKLISYQTDSLVCDY